MLEILEAGFYTSIQDQGRFGRRDLGVPISGPLDDYAATCANSLLENLSDAAVLEFTMTGPKVRFGQTTYFTLTGAAVQVHLNQEPLATYCVYRAAAGDILHIKSITNGYRGYLAVKNGFQTKPVMNSRSMYRYISDAARIAKGNEIPYSRNENFSPKISEMIPKDYLNTTALRVTQGPEYRFLSDKHLDQVFRKDFSISNTNDRMAYQLSENITTHEISILTSATLPGTVQLTPSGKLIILMKDGQTTGGYPRILQLKQEDLSILAQKKSGDSITFQLV